MDEAKAHIKKEAVEKAKDSLSEGTLLLTNRQKLILLPDKSEFGWKTVEEYSQQGLAENEDDGNIRRAEERGEEALKSASTRKTAKQVSSGSALRVHVFLHREGGFFRVEVPGVASVTANTFLVAPPLITRQDREISSLLANLVIVAGPNTT